MTPPYQRHKLDKMLTRNSLTSFTAKAEAEAEAILVKAKAEAEAIRLKVSHLSFCSSLRIIQILCGY